MVLALDTNLRKLLAVLASVAASALLALPVWSHLHADHFSRQGTQVALRKAIDFEPANAELRNRLGRVLLYSPLGDTKQALHELDRATRMDPRTAAFWLDLALAHELEGNWTAAAGAFQAARAAEPRTPAVLWRLANFELRRGENERALAALRDLLAQAPEYTGRALPVFARVAGLETLLDRAVPFRSDALAAALDYVRIENDVAGAPLVWQRLLELGEPLQPGQVRYFLDWVLLGGRGRLGARIWRDAAERGWIPVSAADASALLYNGDFSHPLLNYGLDWHIAPNPDASVWMEPGGAEPGQQSLCVRFREDSRDGYWHVRHWIPVEPGHHYTLNAWLRSERLLSRRGAYLQLDESRPDVRISAQTEPVLGNSKWTEVMIRFAPGPQTELINLSLIRAPSGPGGPPASGMVCLAGVSWKDLGAPLARSATK